MYQGIKFIYPGGVAVRSKYFLKRRYQDGLGFIKSIILIRKLKKENNLKRIIFYGNYLFFEFFLCFFSRMLQIEIFKEESENPNVYFKKTHNPVKLMLKWLCINKLYHYYHVVIVMTEPLKSFFLSIGIKSERILLVSQTVDIDRFEKLSWTSDEYNFPYIAYAGSLDQKKDGVLSLVRAYALIASKYPEIQLIVIGTGSIEDQKRLTEEISRFKLNNRIIVKGAVPANRIPYILKNAKILASCRPNSLQADYGFPTKVVEYMACNKPMVSTNTGELANYLKDRENSFVSKSSDPDDFSAKIIEVLENHEFALEVASRGKELVKNMFDPKLQSLRIINFKVR